MQSLNKGRAQPGNLLEENLRFVSDTKWRQIQNDIILLKRVMKEDELLRALAYTVIAPTWKGIVRKESSNTPFSCGDIRDGFVSYNIPKYFLTYFLAVARNTNVKLLPKPDNWREFIAIGLTQINTQRTTRPPQQPATSSRE